VFVLCTGRAVRGGQDCLVTVHTHSSSWALLISVLSYSKTSADTGVERCRLSIFCVSQLHTHTHTSDYYTFTSQISTHFMLVGGELFLIFAVSCLAVSWVFCCCQQYRVVRKSCVNLQTVVKLERVRDG